MSLMSSETGETKLQGWGENTCFRMFLRALKNPLMKLSMTCMIIISYRPAGNCENDFRLREGYAKSTFQDILAKLYILIIVGLGCPLKTEDPYPN